ncbi:hypothetical protein SLS58_008632 [Diplodia intermedia]|uniref:F-box domain-containing protein n=1 Tax=Diplodia intermedia TaxID=856260 RepID=A0ABR3TH54_9PEZI
MWKWTRSRSRRPDVPTCEPRDTLPLPAEITRRILFFVSEPTITYDRRERTYKYGGPRNLHHPSDDIENARLVCKAFADLGAEFLFRNLIVSADYKQLAHVKEIAGHPRLCKAVRSLYYDCRTYDNIWTKADGTDIDDGSDFEEDEDLAIFRGPPWAPDQRLLYNEQEDIFNQSLDTECLRAALTTLTAVTRVRCKPRERSHHDPGDVSSAGRRGHDHGGGGAPSRDRDARPLYHLAAAMTSVPGGHNIRTLNLTFHITLLADAQLAPARFASLLAALAPVTSLTLGLRTDEVGLCRSRDLARYAAAYGPHATAPSLFRAILAHPFSHPSPSLSSSSVDDDKPTTTALGPLAALADALSPSLHRIKLILSPDGRRRRSTSPGHHYSLPLTSFLGTAAASPTTTTSTPPPTTTPSPTTTTTPTTTPHPLRWPTLRYLALGGLDATQRDLLALVLPRRRALAYVELDRVALARGQWCVVGAAVLDACPAWRWSKANALTQAEPGGAAGAGRW